ncbi:hypothetical protein FHS29_000250 [Saccharothrix tamanrassetensis]|uniref:Uncharacterized protein n=1 Tax=Saccharothrix tamanrassetensis TaxID=1051531 RepID=A0A841C9P1_9PSEU|nr:hypothetical protein [Saccharothrix tamanrassetensis]MBB5953680.1 hypothetical protein [Saccharothrix tamanrassetensis]
MSVSFPNSPETARGHRRSGADRAWAALAAYRDAFTCYSAAVAASSALSRPDWRDTIDLRLTLALTGEPAGLFGFAHFAPGFAGRVRLARAGTDSADEALDRITAALRRAEPVVIAGDARWLPWQHARESAPHWFTVVAHPEGVEVLDALAMRTAHGEQRPTRTVVPIGDLPGLLLSVPVGDPVFALRERFALGDDAGPPVHRYRWAEIGDGPVGPAPQGIRGPDALRVLARHFREHATEPDAYRQVDDLWSVARHRACAVRRAAELGPGSHDWTQRYGRELDRRWAQVAPRAMYAAMSGGAGAPALSDLLDDLAELEQSAAPQLGGST